MGIGRLPLVLPPVARQTQARAESDGGSLGAAAPPWADPWLWSVALLVIGLQVRPPEHEFARSRFSEFQAADRLRQGIGFLVYPEGTRTRSGAIGPFKKGGFHMAIDTGALIVVTEQGERRALRSGEVHLLP